MGTYYIPRNVKGESRILMVFSVKGLIFTAIGAVVGLIFYMIFSIFELNMIGIGFIVSVSTGIIFGVYPALVAAKLRPVDALRIE